MVLFLAAAFLQTLHQPEVLQRGEVKSEQGRIKLRTPHTTSKHGICKTQGILTNGSQHIWLWTTAVNVKRKRLSNIHDEKPE